MKWHHKILFITFGIVVLGLIFGVWKEKMKAHSEPPVLTTGTQLSQAKDIPTFSLTDETHRRFTQEGLKNQWTLLFFGYSKCPELCPKTLALMTEIKKNLSINTPFQMVFVTINPEVDTADQLKSFLNSEPLRSGKFKGLTGNRADIQALAQEIGLYIQEEIPDAGHIEHSGTLLVVNPKGKLHAMITHPTDPQLIAQDLRRMIRYKA